MSNLPEHDEFSTHAVPTDVRGVVSGSRRGVDGALVTTFIAGIEVSSGVGPDLTLAAILAALW